MKEKTKKSKMKIPGFKKTIMDFLLNEEGKIVKKNLSKIGLSLLFLSLTLESQNSQAMAAGHANSTGHSNSMNFFGQGGHTSGPYVHSNFVHGNHSNHSHKGWC